MLRQGRQTVFEYAMYIHIEWYISNAKWKYYLQVSPDYLWYTWLFLTDLYHCNWAHCPGICPGTRDSWWNDQTFHPHRRVSDDPDCVRVRRQWAIHIYDINGKQELVWFSCIVILVESYLNLYSGSLEADGVREALRGSKLFCFHFLYLACSFRSFAITEPMPELSFSSCSASRCRRLQRKDCILIAVSLEN